MSDTHKATYAARVGALALVGLVRMVTANQLFPDYALSATNKFDSAMGADIAGSSFVGADGRFHFISSAADYEQSNSGGSFVKLWTGDDFGAVANKQSNLTTYNTYWNRPGSYCYQLDKRAERPMPSLYQDDHCDVIGIWVDPATKTWWGIVNDEYQFDPWATNKTQNDRIKTGRHNNRVLLSTSTDQGTTWEIVDQLFTDTYQPQQTITPELFPNQTYSWGLSGTRFYPDYITGYAYALYNHQVRLKNGDATMVRYFTMARAPLASGPGLPVNAWRKYAKGRWDQPPIGGHDGLIGEPLGLDVAYDPKTDFLAFEGTGADGHAVSFQANILSTAQPNFTFSDPAGAVYEANAVTKVITRKADGSPVASVVYEDPALERTLAVGLVNSQIQINATDKYGATSFFVPWSKKCVFKDPGTNRLYIQPSIIDQSAFTYNVQSRKYRSVGYDNYVYESSDLGSPNSWVPVGKQAASVLPDMAYTSHIDTGSLTNQNVGGRTYTILSDLRVTMDSSTVTPPGAGQTSFSKDAVPHDATGAPIADDKKYRLNIGGQVLSTKADTQGGVWSFEPVPDEYHTTENSGFYRLRAPTGEYLQVSGATREAQRAWGAQLTTAAKLPGFNAAGNGGKGAGGGSDQWYILPIGGNVPATLDAGSAQGDVDAAQKTDLEATVGYKLVNRNTGWVAVFNNGQFELAPNEFGKNAQQKLDIQPST